MDAEDRQRSRKHFSSQDWPRILPPAPRLVAHGATHSRTLFATDPGGVDQEQAPNCELGGPLRNRDHFHSSASFHGLKETLSKPRKRQQSCHAVYPHPALSQSERGLLSAPSPALLPLGESWGEGCQKSLQPRRATILSSSRVLRRFLKTRGYSRCVPSARYIQDW